MKKLALITLALLAGTAMAAAQGTNAQQQGGNTTERAAPAPQAQQKAPAEKMGSSHKAQSRQSKPAETTGQSSKDTDIKSGADMKADQHKGGAAQKLDEKSGKATTGQNEKSSMDTKADEKTKSSMDNKANEKTKSSMDNKANEKTNAATNDKQKNNTTGQGAAGGRGAANLSTEQKTKIRTVVREKVHAQPVTHVNFSVSVGTVVPRTLHFYPLPAEVISIYPAWRGYEFILVGDEIVVIEPSSFRIVAVIA
jgi:hypothetical protein